MEFYKQCLMHTYIKSGYLLDKDDFDKRRLVEKKLQILDEFV